MIRSFQIKERGLQILKLLKLHGPLSFRGLKAMVEPEIKDRRLHSSLARLTKNGFIRRRQERVFRGTGVFYQLRQEDEVREQIALVLKCQPDELLQPYFRSRELMHTEACALLAHRLGILFPESLLIRDFEFPSHSFAHEILLTERGDYELCPDVLMIFKSDAVGPMVSVAFEVERSRKSEQRLVSKLNKYARGTVLDGLVYVCDSKAVSVPVCQVFKAKVNPDALRINHYGEYFFLFSDEPNQLFLGKTKMFNSDGMPISLEAWVTQLRSVPLVLRRNKNFQVGAVSCSHLEKNA